MRVFLERHCISCEMIDRSSLFLLSVWLTAGISYVSQNRVCILVNFSVLSDHGLGFPQSVPSMSVVSSTPESPRPSEVYPGSGDGCVSTGPIGTSDSGYTPSQSDIPRLPMSENLDFRVSRSSFRITMTMIIDISCLERHCRNHTLKISQSECYTNWEVDTLKKSIQSWLWSACPLSIYRRHFQLQFFSRSVGRWYDVPYDGMLHELANLYHIPRRETTWNFRVKLNEGRTVDNCGQWF